MGGARSRGPREGVVGRWVLRCWYWGMACATMILDGDDDDYGEWGWGAGMRGVGRLDGAFPSGRKFCGFCRRVNSCGCR